MFSGLVKGIGRVTSRTSSGGDVRFAIELGSAAVAPLAVGGSIAVNGVCLTAVTVEPRGFTADVSRETLSLTTLGGWREGTRVNVEKALLAGQALGGHYVTGHVDGVAKVVSRHEDARSVRMVFRVPRELARYVARKGSVCIDGVSLTVNAVEGEVFEVFLIPHTRAVTTLARLASGTRVNLEVDLIARYIERLLTTSPSGSSSPRN